MRITKKPMRSGGLLLTLGHTPAVPRLGPRVGSAAEPGRGRAGGAAGRGGGRTSGLPIPAGAGALPLPPARPGNDSAGAAGAPRRQRAPAPRPAPPRGRPRRARLRRPTRVRAAPQPGGDTAGSAGERPGGHGRRRGRSCGIAVHPVPSFPYRGCGAIRTQLAGLGSLCEVPLSAAVCFSASPAPHLLFAFFLLRPKGQGLFGLEMIPSSKWLLAQTIEPFFVDTGDVSGIAASPNQVQEMLKAPTRYQVLSPFEVYFGKKQKAANWSAKQGEEALRLLLAWMLILVPVVALEISSMAIAHTKLW